MRIKEEKYHKEKRYKRFEGDQLVYYLIHSIIATFIFIYIALQLDFFSLKENTIEYLFTWRFLALIFIVFLWSLVSSMIARIIGYFLLLGIYKHSIPKSFFAINLKGINRLGLRYLLALFITSVLWSLGAITILQDQIFENEDIFSLIIMYVVIKFTVFIITKLMIDVKS